MTPTTSNTELKIDALPEQSEWSCHLFSGKPLTTNYYGIVYTPQKGNEPNWFWRWTQYLVFGNYWFKRNKNG